MIDPVRLHELETEIADLVRRVRSQQDPARPPQPGFAAVMRDLDAFRLDLRSEQSSVPGTAVGMKIWEIERRLTEIRLRLQRLGYF